MAQDKGGILSPYLLFSHYIRELLVAIDSTGVGRFIGNHCFNVLVYADDIVLLAPSWRGLQRLLDVLLVQSSLICLAISCMCFCQKNEIVCTGLYFHVLDLVGVIYSLFLISSIWDTL